MNYARILVATVFLIMIATGLAARAVDDGEPSRSLDLVKYHDVGNIWLRVSNYGFFGSGDDIVPQWPSLEYPGGSGIDYLYQGSLWFGAKLIRRNSAGQRLYWLNFPPEDEEDYVTQGDSLWTPDLPLVVDTLVSVGFDGDADLYELLPAYNPLESGLGTQYGQYNLRDTVLYASIREQRTGVDDDNDGWIDEDPVGYGFPFRRADELPAPFAALGSKFLQDIDPQTEVGAISNAPEIWFPLGFVDLSDDTQSLYNFSDRIDDDMDGFVDEDGYPVSEQDYISYYYDYSPFGTTTNRDWGSYKTRNEHYPLNIRVRQMSYQWSYDYIKNLVYVEFDITNMNAVDTLFDCAMGIYMDSDVGPQTWGADERSLDDISSYITAPYEVAYTYDADQDDGLTTGYVGSRVCTPDPDQLEFACWTWERGEGPNDDDAHDLNADPTANEKYWLLTDRNPDASKYVSLRDFPDTQEGDPCDTRYLFAFYGDQRGMTNPTDSTWNLEPGRTMKIVIAVFPGESEEHLKQTANFAKLIYGEAQTLTNVILPDTIAHYNPPEPPDIPNLYGKVADDGNRIDVYWDNRSEFTSDAMTVTKEQIGWQDNNPNLPSYSPTALDSAGYNENAIIDPITAARLRHDFQGFTLWSRSGTGLQDRWVMIDRWDKIDTAQDLADYDLLINNPDAGFYDFGGDIGNNTGLPQMHYATQEDLDYYHQNDKYELEHYEMGDAVYGYPLHNLLMDQDEIDSLVAVWDDPALNPYFNPVYADDYISQVALMFKHADLSPDIYLALYDDRLIPAEGFLGYNFRMDPELTKRRLARRYFHAGTTAIKKGVETYISLTAFDRGMPQNQLLPLESGRDANMLVFFPGPNQQKDMNDIYVVPNPYISHSRFDGRREQDEKGDRSRRLWFVNLPENCKVRIYTLAGDLVDEIHHTGSYSEDIINVSKAARSGITSHGIHSWDLLSENDQIVTSGVYLFSVENLDTDDIKVGKFVIIR